MGVKTWTKEDDEHLITSLSTGVTYDEIAENLGKTKGAVKSRVRWLRGIGVCPSPDLDEIPKQIMSDYDMYKLYAGRQYEDYNVTKASKYHRVYIRGEVQGQAPSQYAIDAADQD